MEEQEQEQEQEEKQEEEQIETNLYNYFYIPENNIDMLKHQLINIETYDFIYISYGSKKNLFTKDILNSFTGSPIIFLDNSIYQITPIFLLFFFSEAKILCITIDIYNESEKVQQTFDTLLDYYKNENMENNNNNKIDVIFYDIYDSKKSNIIEITSYFKSLFIEKEIKKQNFLFCNFIKFKNPNTLETNIQNEIPVLIYGILKDLYPDSFYQWCGYNYSINMMNYNLIYNYKYQKTLIDSLDNINTILRKFAPFFMEYNWDNNINKDILELLKDKTNKNEISKITIFLENTLNIKEFYSNINNNFQKIQEGGKNIKQPKEKKKIKQRTIKNKKQKTKNKKQKTKNKKNKKQKTKNKKQKE